MKINDIVFDEKEILEAMVESGVELIDGDPSLTDWDALSFDRLFNDLYNNNDIQVKSTCHINGQTKKKYLQKKLLTENNTYQSLMTPQLWHSNSSNKLCCA